MDNHTFARSDSGIQELTMDEVDHVSGGNLKKAGMALGAAAGIGAATWGGTWGAVGVVAAFGAAPLAVIGMAGLVAYGSYHAWNSV